MQNGYGGIDTLTVFPILYRSFFLFSEQTPVLLDAELGFVDTLSQGADYSLADHLPVCGPSDGDGGCVGTWTRAATAAPNSITLVSSLISNAGIE